MDVVEQALNAIFQAMESAEAQGGEVGVMALIALTFNVFFALAAPKLPKHWLFIVATVLSAAIGLGEGMGLFGMGVGEAFAVAAANVGITTGFHKALRNIKALPKEFEEARAKKKAEEEARAKGVSNGAP